MPRCTRQRALFEDGHGDGRHPLRFLKCSPFISGASRRRRARIETSSEGGSGTSRQQRASDATHDSDLAASRDRVGRANGMRFPPNMDLPLLRTGDYKLAGNAPCARHAAHPEAALTTLPERACDWVTRIQTAGTNGRPGYCLDLVDLFMAKTAADRDKDRLHGPDTAWLYLARVQRSVASTTCR